MQPLRLIINLIGSLSNAVILLSVKFLIITIMENYMRNDIQWIIGILFFLFGPVIAIIIQYVNF